MTIRVDTMRSDFENFPRRRLIDGLKLVLPTVVLVAVAFAFLRRANQTLLPVVLDFATAAAVGLTAGFTTRWSLKHRAELLRSLVGVAMTISGLIILGVITWGEVGIRMLYLHTDVDWNGLGQVLVGASSALLALRAWSFPVRFAPPPNTLPEPIPPPAPPRWVARPSNGSIRPNLRVRLSRRMVSLRSRRNASRTPTASRVNNVSETPRVIALPRWKAPRIALPHFNFRSWFHFRESQVKFTGASELRCPYCLDMIVKNDPRGVRVCSICHTPHHADCWATTGMCQIPHYHA